MGQCGGFCPNWHRIILQQNILLVVTANLLRAIGVAVAAETVPVKIRSMSVETKFSQCFLLERSRIRNQTVSLITM
jgi:hypothetical protein